MLTFSSTRRPEPLPGIPSLLRSLDEDERYLCALLTGNWETSAYIKLGSIGLGKWFSFGAFAGEAPSREDLLPIALKRAQEYSGHNTFSPTQVAVIGDTPRDVAVARAHGAKSVAVATGIHSYGDLEAASPDLLLEDLAGSEIKETLAIWAREGLGSQAPMEGRAPLRPLVFTKRPTSNAEGVRRTPPKSIASCGNGGVDEDIWYQHSNGGEEQSSRE